MKDDERHFVVVVTPMRGEIPQERLCRYSRFVEKLLQIALANLQEIGA